MDDISKKLNALLDVITRLRAPDGCPWDQKQTPQTFKNYLIEEAYELLEAINDDNPRHICEELGDLIFQVVFFINLYQEKQLFSFTDVLDGITAKMIRRHPHVFGDQKITCEKELRQNWQNIKNSENSLKNKETGLFDSIPKSLPALRRSQQVIDRVARMGFDWPDLAAAYHKYEEENDELKQAIAENSHERMTEEFGDVLFSLVAVGRKAGINSEDALTGALQKFTSRYTKLQELVAVQGRVIDNLNLQELLNYWNQAKATPDNQPNNV
ncbi:MAG: nucleoside triphosphate pyrophosphohydrolase [Desulfobulbaceae bacterium]|nr:nucleoside triphosphate pyrophosphohydrolase [Desulfobulbaceae bacterium]HIJ78712.1 nucleoside triphosphate pyrophosphohydrolase [Deltaproteobacteria bacterium]